MQAGTVAANYYRVARQHGEGRGPRSGKPAAKAGSSSKRAPAAKSGAAKRPRRAPTAPATAAAASSEDLKVLAREVREASDRLIAAIERRDEHLRKALG